MRGATYQQKIGGASPAILIAGAVALLALPSAVLAFSSSFAARQVSVDKPDTDKSFTPAAADPRLARQFHVASLSAGQVFRFTPAGIALRPDRSVTVAVRIDAQTSRAISVSKIMGVVPVVLGLAPLRLAPTAYNLGVIRGAQGFNLPSDIRRIDMPDLSSFTPSSGVKDMPSRFSPRIALDAREKLGRSPRTLEGSGGQIVDLGGAYRLGKNIDVTAGVRYSQQRDRLVPLTDGKQNGQAVYVGTQFRF